MFNHIQTSIIGAHSQKQDAIKYYEDEYRVVAVVADGLGSKERSAEGAKLVCRLLCRELRGKPLPLEPTEGLLTPGWWQSYLTSRECDPNDYCTTCSFVVVDKLTQRICLGQIGDSPIFAHIDDDEVVEMRPEKDFTNCTDCLGGGQICVFDIKNYSYRSSLRVFISTDGIGDELSSEVLPGLLDYLAEKYQAYQRCARSRQFTKEIKACLGSANRDDKSAIYIWKNSRM